MPNLAVHQLPIAQTILDGDVSVLSRETSPGVFKDYQFDLALIGLPIFSETTAVSSAQILDLFATRVLLVTAPGDGSVIQPVAYMANLSGVGTPYATNVSVRILGSTASTINQYWSTFDIDSASDFSILGNNGVSPACRLYADENLYLQAATGNPTAGDGDLVVTVYYRLLPT